MKLMKHRGMLSGGSGRDGRTGRRARAAVPPNPILYLTGTEFYTANGQDFVRYRYDVFNKDAYPAAMFAAAPGLPPCGNNTNSSRSWVDFFDSRRAAPLRLLRARQSQQSGPDLVRVARRPGPAELCLYRDQRPPDQHQIPVEPRRHGDVSKSGSRVDPPARLGIRFRFLDQLGGEGGTCMRALRQPPWR